MSSRAAHGNQQPVKEKRPVRDSAAPSAVTKGAGSRTKGVLMAYKLLDMAQARWRRLDGAHLLPLVRAGIIFVDGVRREGKTNVDRFRPVHGRHPGPSTRRPSRL